MQGNGHALDEVVAAVSGSAVGEEIVYDLLVIGGGPVGLASAIAAASRGGCGKVVLVDQTSSFRKAGDFINVNPNGIHALRLFAPEVANALIAMHSGGKGFVMRDVSGNVYDLPDTDDVDGIPNVGSTWYAVQKLLLDTVLSMPDKIRVHTNAQFVEFEHYNGTDDAVVTAKLVAGKVRKNPFAHWGNDPNSTTYEEPSNAAGNEGSPSGAEEGNTAKECIYIKARCVFACDGMNSKARKEVYRLHGKDVQGAKAYYSGFISLKGTVGADVRLTADLEEAVEKLYVAEGGGISMAGGPSSGDPDMPTIVVFRFLGDLAKKFGMRWRIIAHAVVDEAIATTTDVKEVGPAVLEQLEAGGFPACIRQLFKEILFDKEESKIIIRPLYTVPVSYPPNYPVSSKSTVPPARERSDGIVPFGYGRIFLVGDSLHGMPPFLSQGTSTGFEDVAELAALLFNKESSSSIDYEEVQKKYVEARRTRIEKAQRETLARRWAHDQEAYARNLREMRHFVARNTF